MRHKLFALYLLLAVAMLIWPLYPVVGAAAEPRVLGLPWSLAWHVFWALATFAALAVYHATNEED